MPHKPAPLTDQQIREIRESRERLSPIGWPVAPDYRIEDGLVVPLDAHGRFIPHRSLDASYMPAARPELPGEFAKLSGAHDKDVLTFVQRYGLLGYADALTPFEAHALRAARSTRTFDQFIDKSYDTELRGDPVAWILAHAETVGFILALADGLDRPNELRRILEQRIVTEGDVEELRFVRAVRGRTRPKQGRLPVPRGDSHVREAVAGIIALALADNLGGITRNVAVGDNGLVSFFRFNNLLDDIYWMLADAVTGRRIRQCPECGHFFIADTDRVKYCPRPMGHEGVSSLCMHRLKVRRWRKKRKDEDQRTQQRRKRAAARPRRRNPR